MKTTSLNKVIVPALLVFLLSFVSASAAERGVVRTQGRVDELQLKKNTMVVNESKFVWDSNTLFYDEKGSPLLDKNGSPAKAEALKNKNWVYIVGVRQKDKPTLIQKLYVLPKHIDKSERHLYRFMQ